MRPKNPTFSPPFRILEELSEEALKKLGYKPSKNRYEVIDAKMRIISTHRDRAGAEQGLEAARRAYPE